MHVAELSRGAEFVGQVFKFRQICLITLLPCRIRQRNVPECITLVQRHCFVLFCEVVTKCFNDFTRGFAKQHSGLLVRSTLLC